jgi:hypothetical protein
MTPGHLITNLDVHTLELESHDIITFIGKLLSILMSPYHCRDTQAFTVTQLRLMVVKHKSDIIIITENINGYCLVNFNVVIKASLPNDTIELFVPLTHTKMKLIKL